MLEDSAARITQVVGRVRDVKAELQAAIQRADRAASRAESALRIAQEAMRLLSDDQLVQLRQRMDELEGGEELAGMHDDNGGAGGGPGGGAPGAVHS